MKKLLFSLLLLSSFSTFAGTPSVQIGNGLGFEVVFDKVALYVAEINSKEYTLHLGVDYLFAKTETYSFGVGFGGTTVKHDFTAVDGFAASKDTETIPFVVLSVRSQYLFAKLFYADTNFNTRRVKFTPTGQVVRLDTASGPEYGVFVGFQIPIN